MKTLALASFLAGLALLGARADINLEDTVSWRREPLAERAQHVISAKTADGCGKNSRPEVTFEPICD